MRHALVMSGLLFLGALAASGCRDAPPPPVATATATATASATASAAPAPPPPVSPESARRGAALAERAERCLADLRCSLAEATRLYLEADDAGATQVSCFRFYYGVGVPADPARARACFERAVAREKGFAGSSPSLERIFLGLMLLDGQGGARDRKRGRGLFADCYLGNDSGVSAAAEEREKSGAAKPIDFCQDIGGTTLDTNACAEVGRDRETVGAQKEVKEIVAKLALDDAGLALWDKAESAWDRFSYADARYVGDAYRGGSMRIVQETSVAAAHARERAEVLRALFDSKLRREDAEDDLKQAEERARAKAPDAANKKLLADAEAAWKAYRAAEIAFVRRGFAREYGGAEAAARAASAELAKRWAEGLRETAKALHSG